MRCSSLNLLEHWAVYESPILPFLAPAVFAPWLYPLYPSHTQPLERSKPLQKFYGSTDRKSKNGQSATGRSLRRYGALASHRVQLPIDAHTIQSSAAPIGRRSFHSHCSRRQKACSDAYITGTKENTLPNATVHVKTSNGTCRSLENSEVIGGNQITDSTEPISPGHTSSPVSPGDKYQNDQGQLDYGRGFLGVQTPTKRLELPLSAEHRAPSAVFCRIDADQSSQEEILARPDNDFDKQQHPERRQICKQSGRQTACSALHGSLVDGQRQNPAGGNDTVLPRIEHDPPTSTEVLSIRGFIDSALDPNSPELSDVASDLHHQTSHDNAGTSPIHIDREKGNVLEQKLTKETVDSEQHPVCYEKIRDRDEKRRSTGEFLSKRLTELRLRASSVNFPQRSSFISQEKQAPWVDLDDPNINAYKESHLAWSLGMDRLSMKFHHQPWGFEVQHSQTDVQGQELTSMLPPIGSNGEKIREAWLNRAPESRIVDWSTLMVYYLEYSPAHALTFLNATIMEPGPLAKHIAGGVDIIAQLLGHRGFSSTEEHHFAYFAVFQKILEHYKTAPPFTQRSLLTLAQLFPLRVDSTLEMLESKNVRLHYRTLLHFGRALAHSQQHMKALNVLRQAIAKGASPASVDLLKVCSTLVRSARGKEGNYEESSKIVAALFGMGIRLNIFMYNILLLNASEAGDPGTAWRIYQMIRDNDVSPDEYTYTIMMKMCRKTDEKQQFRFLYFELNPENRELNPYLVTEILACRYHFNLRSNFDHVLRFYERHCDLQPLKDLGIIPSSHEIRFESQSTNLQGPRQSPCAGTLGMMILAFVRQEQRVGPVQQVYDNFLRLLKEENPVILPLVATTHTYNVFLKAYSRSAGSLARWRDIIRDMVAPLSPDLINRETGLPLRRARPSAQTWNIIVNGLARAGQDADAEKLMALMRRNKMEPDLVTWNSLLAGFAKGQKVFRVAGVLRTMEETGTKPDGYTRKALVNVRNQGRLLKHMASGVNKKRAKRSTVPPSGGISSGVKGLVRDTLTSAKRRPTTKGGNYSPTAAEKKTRAAGKALARKLFSNPRARLSLGRAKGG